MEVLKCPRILISVSSKAILSVSILTRTYNFRNSDDQKCFYFKDTFLDPQMNKNVG